MGDLIALVTGVFEMDKGFGDRFGVRASSKLSVRYAVGNKAMVSSHPGIEFPQGLLKMGRGVILEQNCAGPH
jgi:hypothetical protein